MLAHSLNCSAIKLGERIRNALRQVTNAVGIRATTEIETSPLTDITTNILHPSTIDGNRLMGWNILVEIQYRVTTNNNFLNL